MRPPGAAGSECQWRDFLFLHPHAQGANRGDEVFRIPVAHREVGDGDGHLAGLEVVEMFLPDMAAAQPLLAPRRDSVFHFGKRLAVEVKGVALARIVMDASIHPDPVAVAFLGRRHVEGSAQQHDVVADDRRGQGALERIERILGDPRLGFGNRFLHLHAEWRLPAFPAGLLRIERGSEPVIEACGQGDFNRSGFTTLCGLGL